MLIFNKYLQIISSLLIILLVLVQGKGGGISGSLSGSFGAYHTKRGVEKVIFYLTILLGVVLTLNSVYLILNS